MATNGWNEEAWARDFGQEFDDNRDWDGWIGDVPIWDEWDPRNEFSEGDFVGHNLAALDLVAREPLDDLSSEDFLTRRSEDRTRGASWNWIAPVNVDAEGRIFRKTRFPVFLGGPTQAEWMWVQVRSLDDRVGILANQPFLIPALSVGDEVRFEVIPEGRPLEGCAEAVEW